MEEQHHPSRTSVLVSILAMALLATGLLSVVAPRPAVAQSTTNVSIVDYAFSPKSITVVIGVNNTVMWTYYTGYAYHTVTANDGSFYSPYIDPGGSFTHTFTVAGTYGYHCSVHTYMTGTVIVKNAVSSSTSTTTSQSSTHSTSTTSTSTSSTSTSTTQSSTSSTSSTSTSSPVYSRPTISSTTAQTSNSNTNAYGSGGGIPEFPYQGAALAVITLLVLASYLVVRQGRSRRTKA